MGYAADEGLEVRNGATALFLDPTRSATGPILSRLLPRDKTVLCDNLLLCHPYRLKMVAHLWGKCNLQY